MLVSFSMELRHTRLTLLRLSEACLGGVAPINQIHFYVNEFTWEKVSIGDMNVIHRPLPVIKYERGSMVT